MIRVGVIGVGHLGSIHASLWRNVQGVQLVGVVDHDAATAARVAASAGTKVYESVTALLSDVDAVSIVTPTQTHAAVALEALAAGIHCFIEKPIAATVSAAREIDALAKKNSRVVQIGHIERFNPALLALDKTIVEPLFIESHRLAQYKPRATDVAVVHDLMIHDVNQVFLPAIYLCQSRSKVFNVLSLLDFFFNASDEEIADNQYQNRRRTSNNTNDRESLQK